MNSTHSWESVDKKFEIRKYQYNGWRDMLSVIKQYLEGTLLLNGKIKDIDESLVLDVAESLLGTMNYKENIDLKTSIPLWMATGSGKSYTMGEMMNKIFKLRNRYFPDHPINSLVLNDRISLVDQLHTDFIEGRDGKPWFLVEHDIHTQIFHSKADQQVEEAYHGDSDEEDHEIDMTTLVNDDEVEIQENTTVSQDTMYFSTLQTAYLKNLDQQITDLDVIIIDEAHKLAGKQKYETLMRFYKPNKQGRLPLVFVLSATMNPILHLVNDPVIQFGLPEYIASPYSPEVNYNLVTTHEWTQDDIKFINDQIVQISLIEDLKEKKRAVADLKEQLEEMLKKSTMTDQDLVTDFLQRAPLLDHTIVFAKDIAQADYLAAEFNRQAWNIDTAIAIHSRIDQTDAEVLHAYKSGEKKIIVAVNKLNEGIDIPQTNNIVFWRDTDSDTIFQQQFGRWLRWDEVNVYDYVGGLRNLSWIQGIHQAVEQIHGNGEEDVIITPIDPEEDDNTTLLGSDEERNSDIFDDSVVIDSETLDEKEQTTLPDLPLVDGNPSSEFEANEDETHWWIKQPSQEQEHKKNINIRTLGVNDLFSDAPQVDIEWLFEKILKFDEELNIALTEKMIKKELDELWWYDILMKYTQKDIRWIEIWWYKIASIAKSYWFVSKYDFFARTPKWFQEFVSYVYWKEFQYDVKEKIELTPEIIKKELDELWWYEELMKYSKKDIEWIEIWWYKIASIAKSYWFVSKYDFFVRNQKWFQEFVSYVYEKEFEYKQNELTPEIIKKELDELWWYEELMKYSKKDIEWIEIWWYKIASIAKSYWFVSKYDFFVRNQKWFQEFVSYVYEKEFEYKQNELTPEIIKKELDELWWYEELMKYSKKDIEWIEIWWYKIASIAKSYWFISKYDLNIRTPKWFQEFISYVYGEEFVYKK